jgi:hypothetical protein
MEITVAVPQGTIYSEDDEVLFERRMTTENFKRTALATSARWEGPTGPGWYEIGGMTMHRRNQKWYCGGYFMHDQLMRIVIQPDTSRLVSRDLQRAGMSDLLFDVFGVRADVPMVSTQPWGTVSVYENNYGSWSLDVRYS